MFGSTVGSREWNSMPLGRKERVLVHARAAGSLRKIAPIATPVAANCRA